MPETQPWTIGRLLQWTSNYLQQQGSTSPRLDAEILLAEALHRPRIQLYTSYEEEPEDDVRSAFRELVRRRAAGEPVAYLVGRREFYSLSFDVTPDVLIPRPETEFVVIALLDAIKERPASDRPLEIIDVGTGSGVLAICAAKHVTRSRVTAVDIHNPALDVARRNARAHQVLERIEFLESDLLGSLREGRQFDFVISNPPYVSESEFAETSTDVKDYEPRLALVGGPTGAEVIARLVSQSGQQLAPGGLLITEISPMLEHRVHELINDDGRFETATTVKDLAGLARVVTARRSESA